MIAQRIPLLFISCLLCILFSCKKDNSSVPPPTPPKPVTNLYSDTLFFIQNSNDYFIRPVKAAQGNYVSFPDGLDIDEKTGEINVNKSETGLKYRVSFIPDGAADTLTSYLIVSGINYEDKIYNLSQGDSIAAPIYNANPDMPLPGSNNNLFDESSGCKNAGIIVGADNGVINLAKTVRNQGIDTGATAQVKLAYRISDNSNKSLNGLEMKIYFYRTAAEIPQYLTDLLKERKGTILTSNVAAPSTIQPRQLALSSLAVNARSVKAGRPRPPCIIVVSR